MLFKTYLKKDLREIVDLFKSHLLAVAVVILSYAGTYALNLYLAKILEPKAYGDIAVVLQFLVFVVPFALLGTEVAMVRFIPQYIEAKEYGKIAGFFRWSTKIYLYASLIIVILGSLFSLLLWVLTKENVQVVEKYHIIVHSYWLIPLIALIVLLSKILLSMQRFYLSAFLRGFTFSLFVIGIIALLMGFFEHTWLGLYSAKFSVLLCVGIACLIIIGLQLYALFKVMPKKYLHAKPIYQKRRWYKSSFEMLTGTIVYVGINTVNLFMVEIFAKNEEHVAHYAAILVIAGLVYLFSSAVDLLVNPIISPCVENNNKSHLQSIIHIMNLFKVIPGLIMSIIIILFGNDFLLYFGKGYAGAYGPLLIMLLGFFLGMCLSSSGSLLLYSGHQKMNIIISSAQLLFLIIGGSIFIPFFGITGAVWVLTLSIVLSAIVRCLAVRKYLEIHSFYFI